MTSKFCPWAVSSCARWWPSVLPTGGQRFRPGVSSSAVSQFVFYGMADAKTGVAQLERTTVVGFNR
jgi:hypothetical protein